MDRKTLLRWTTGGTLACILIVTLRPTTDVVAPGFNWCIGCSEFGTLDLLHNAALFLPLGVLLALRGWGVGRVFVASAALSIGIEFMQLVVVPGRDATLTDVVANALGGAVAVPVARAPAFLRRAPARVWRALGWTWVGISIAVLALGTWVVSVTVPYADYYVQWVPVRPFHSPFLGKLDEFEVNGVQLTNGTRVPATAFPAEYFKGIIDVRARLTAGEMPNDRIALIARLALEYGDVVMLGQQQNSLVLRYRSNAPRIGMRSPIYAFPRVFVSDSGVVDVRAIKRPHSVELFTTTRAGPKSESARSLQRVTGARFWAALLPSDYGFGRSGVLGDLIWLALLAAPAAYAGARAYSGAGQFAPSIAQAAGFAVLALTVAPSLWYWPIWLGIAVGVVGGFRLGSRARGTAVERIRARAIA